MTTIKKIKRSYAHQEAYVRDRYNREVDVLAWSPRTGKTKTMIDTATKLYKEGEIKAVLVVCSVHAIEEWDRQIKEHSEVEADIYPMRLSKPLTKVKAMEWANDDQGKLKYFVVNREAILSTKKVLAPIVEMLKFADKAVMFIKDESHRVRMGGKTWKRLEQISMLCKYRRLLSGTFVTNRPEGVYFQLRLLAKEPLSCKDIKHFSDMYCFTNRSLTRRGYNPHPVNKWDPKMFLVAMGYFKQQYGTILRREDCKDLPEIISEIHHTYLSDEQLDIYQKMVAIDESKSDSDMLKLYHSAYADGYSKEHGILFPSTKLGIIKEIIQDVKGEENDKVVIFTNFILECNDIFTYLQGQGFKCVQVKGDNSRTQNQLAVSLLQNGSCDVLVANVTCVQDSIGLDKASTVIWASPVVDSTVWRQAIDRVSAIGKDSVGEHCLIAYGTIQETIYNIAQDKMAFSRTMDAAHG